MTDPSRRIPALCCALLLSLSPAGAAAEFSEAGDPWPERAPRPDAMPERSGEFADNTLAGVYELALENDKTLAAARATYRAGLEERKLGRSELLPRISASYGRSDSHRESRGSFPAGGAIFPNRTDSDAETEQWSVSLEQPVFDLPAWFRFQRGHALTDQAEATFTVAQQDLIVRTTDAYFGVLRAMANLQASRAQEQALQAQLEQVQQRFEVGLVAITDVHEAQAAYDLAVADRLADEGDVRVTLEQLSVLTGRSHARLWQLADDFPVADPSPRTVDDWVGFARRYNEDIEVARHARDVAKKEARAAQSEHLPSVDLALSLSDQDTDVNQNDLVTGSVAEFASDQKQNQIALNVTMPVFTGGGISASRRRAWARFESQAQSYAATVREVTQATRARYISVIRDVARTRARARAIVSSRSALEAAETGYEVGTRNVVDVLDAQRTLFSAIRDHSNSIIDYVQDVVALKRRAGNLTPADVYELNGWLEKPPPASRSGQGDDGLLPLPPSPSERRRDQSSPDAGGSGGGSG